MMAIDFAVLCQSVASLPCPLQSQLPSSLCPFAAVVAAFLFCPLQSQLPSSLCQCVEVVSAFLLCPLHCTLLPSLCPSASAAGAFNQSPHGHALCTLMLALTINALYSSTYIVDTKCAPCMHVVCQTYVQGFSCSIL